MKQLYIIILLIGTANYGLLAQQVENPASINAIADYQQGSVKLRWNVDNDKAFQSLNQNGYTIIRRTTADNSGAEISLYDQYTTQVTLIEGYKPLAEDEFEAKFGTDNNTANAACKILYDTSLDIAPVAAPSIKDAYELQIMEESKHIFGMILAEQDFEVACAMGLAYIDESVVSGYTYSYAIKPTLLDSTFVINQGIATIVANNEIIRPKPEIEGYGEPNIAVLTWDLVSLENHYSTYDIWRSEDGTNYTKVNDQPFVYMSTSDQLGDTAFYKDSIVSNDQTYYYKVCGKTPFGNYGELSDPIPVKGKYPRLALQMRLDSFEIINETVNFFWDYLDASYNQDLQGYNIYYSNNSVTGFEKINTNLISASARTYTYEDAPEVGYYKIEAIDIHDEVYSSYEILVQMEDNEPPLIPTGLSGSYTSNNELSLTWNANTEEDLKGYRVFVSNERDGTFVESTNYPLLSTSFTHDTDDKFVVDSVFVKICAEDNRSNYSEKSPIVAFSRPNTVAPASPVLAKLLPTPQGVEVEWQYSSDDDVVQHVLQRKYSSAGTWEDVIVIDESNIADYPVTNPNLAIVAWLDSSELENRSYDYRMTALDNDNNLGGSDIKTVTPFSSGVQGDITNFSLELESEALPSNVQNDILVDNLKKAGYNANSLRSSASNRYHAILGWSYELDQTVVDFQVYRAISGGPMQLYRSISVATALGLEDADADVTGSVGTVALGYKDEDLIKGKRYIYQVMARHSNGGASKRSNTLTKKVPKN